VGEVLDRYGHLLPGVQDQVTDALDRLARNAHERTRDTGMGLTEEFGMCRARTLCKRRSGQALMGLTRDVPVGDAGLEPVASAV
jgi:hypothetical protein